MNRGPTSGMDRISHSTPKGTPSPRPPSSSTVTESNRSARDRSDRSSSYADTFQGSSLASRSASIASRSASVAPRSASVAAKSASVVSRSASVAAKTKSDQPELNETGESTRSLLSVLSHSSVESLSTGSISSTGSQKSSVDRSHQPLRSGNIANETIVISDGQEVTHDSGQATEEPSPWERWLIEKSKLEREKIRDEALRNRNAIIIRQAEEERNRDKRRQVEARVLDWLREKEVEERKRKATERERKRRERTERSTVKQRKAEKDKEKRDEWLSQKQERELKDRERAESEKRERCLEERLRKQQAEEAFRKWKKESQNRPRPSTGGFSSKGHPSDGSYPVPAFINPVPWMPIETPTPLSSTRQKKGSTKKKKAAQNSMDTVVESPPLLFRDRAKKENLRQRARPR